MDGWMDGWTDRQTDRQTERDARSDAYFILVSTFARLVYNVKHVLIRAGVKNSF